MTQALEVNMIWITAKLNYEKKDALKAKQLHEIYKTEGGTSGFDSFYRKLRNVIEEARRSGIRIAGLNNGFFIAVDDVEWDEYCRATKSRAMSLIETIALSNRIPPLELVKGWFFADKKKRKPNFVQPSLFEGENR